MKNTEKQALVEKLVKDLIAAPSCCAEAKACGEAYLAAVGTPQEDAAAKALIVEMEEDVCTIDDAIVFYNSDFAAKIFGADGAKERIAQAEEAKASGVWHCICPACTAGAAILAEKDAILDI